MPGVAAGEPPRRPRLDGMPHGGCLFAYCTPPLAQPLGGTRPLGLLVWHCRPILRAITLPRGNQFRQCYTPCSGGSSREPGERHVAHVCADCTAMQGGCTVSRSSQPRARQEQGMPIARAQCVEQRGRNVKHHHNHAPK